MHTYGYCVILEPDAGIKARIIGRGEEDTVTGIGKDADHLVQKQHHSGAGNEVVRKDRAMWIEVTVEKCRKCVQEACVPGKSVTIS